MIYKHKTLALAAGLGFLALTTQTQQARAQQQEEEKRREPRIGADFSIYMPLSGATRRRFGQSFIGVGPALGSVRPQAGGRLRPDFELLRESNNRNKAFLLVAGAEYRRPFAREIEEKARFVPYYSAGLNLVYGSIEVPTQGRDGSGLGVGASIALGTAVGRRAFVEARLRGLTSIERLDFSGVALTAGLRF